jgi:hypothetical protein
MAEAKEKTQVDIGFAGGQAISVRVDPSELKSLRKALGSGSGWHELETADGPVSLDLQQVVFVKADASDHKIGFSGL